MNKEPLHYVKQLIRLKRENYELRLKTTNQSSCINAIHNTNMMINIENDKLRNELELNQKEIQRLRELHIHTKEVMMNDFKDSMNHIKHRIATTTLTQRLIYLFTGAL